VHQVLLRVPLVLSKVPLALLLSQQLLQQLVLALVEHS
jgi:hypothetical protein